jgi:hypothetical protein
MLMLKRLWHDERGVIVSAEIVMIMTVLVIGVMTGLTSIRDGVIEELADVGPAIGNIDQSFIIGGSVSHASAVSSSVFIDTFDFCDGFGGGFGGFGGFGGGFGGFGGFGGGFNSRCLVINGGVFAAPVVGLDTGIFH